MNNSARCVKSGKPTERKEFYSQSKIARRRLCEQISNIIFHKICIPNAFLAKISWQRKNPSALCGHSVYERAYFQQTLPHPGYRFAIMGRSANFIRATLASARRSAASKRRNVCGTSRAHRCSLPKGCGGRRYSWRCRPGRAPWQNRLLQSLRLSRQRNRPEA